MLYTQFYLQCFLQKVASFLEYLAFMTKYCVIYLVSILVKLDNKIRQFCVQHTELNWDMTGPQVQQYLLDVNINLQQVNSQFNTFSTPQKCSKSHRCGGRGRQKQQSWNQGYKKQGNYGSQDYNQGYSSNWDQNNGWESSDHDREWNEQQNCCHNWSLQECNNCHCPHDHICYFVGDATKGITVTVPEVIATLWLEKYQFIQMFTMFTNCSLVSHCTCY